MWSRRRRRLVCLAPLACGLLVSACGGGVFKREHEYEEEVYLALDGSATVTVNASVASLVALRGVDLNVSPRARIDRLRVRAMFEGPEAVVTRVTLYRRHGRRFVFVSLDVASLRQLRGIAPLAWSTYGFDRRANDFEFRQILGPSAGLSVGEVGWHGDELVAFRVHAPSRIVVHNAPRGIQRGNILEWEQPLGERLKGAPLELRAQLEPESILYSALLLFASTIVLAAIAFAIVVWRVARKHPGGRR